MRAGVGDVGSGDCFVKNANGIDLVAEVFQWLESLADRFGGFEVVTIDSSEHFLGEIGTDADTAGGESIDLKLREVRDGRLFADAADDEFGVDEFDELGEIIVLRRVLADDGVFNPGNEAVVDERSDGFRFKVTFKLDVEDAGLTKGFDEFPEAVCYTGVGSESLHRQDHDGGEVEIAEDHRLIHHGAISGTDGGDDEGVVSTFGRDDVEGLGVFAGSDVVKIGIAAIEESRDSAVFDVSNDLGVFFSVDFEIRVARQGGNGDDVGVELLGRNR